MRCKSFFLWKLFGSNIDLMGLFHRENIWRRNNSAKFCKRSSKYNAKSPEISHTNRVINFFFFFPSYLTLVVCKGVPIVYWNNIFKVSPFKLTITKTVDSLLMNASMLGNVHYVKTSRQGVEWKVVFVTSCYRHGKYVKIRCIDDQK